MYYIYWIHLDTFTDPLSEGYIGISKQFNQRYNTHTKYANAYSKKVREVIDEYGVEVIQHTLLSKHQTLREAKKAEKDLRPSKHIGWNIMTGGGTTPDCTGRTHSDYSKYMISKSNKLTKHLRGYVPSIFKGMTNRHSKETKELIGSYHKGKSISVEHRQAITEKLSGENNPKARCISMFHINTPKTIHKFSCIKDAAIALDINYSTIRSSVRLLKKNPNRQGWCILWD